MFNVITKLENFGASISGVLALGSSLGDIMVVD